MKTLKPHTLEDVKEKVREVFRKIKERIDDITYAGFSRELAYVGVPNGVNVRAYEVEKAPYVMHFDVGPLPKKGTPTREISELEVSVDVLYPNEITEEVKKSGKKYLTIDQAREEVRKIRNSDGSCHEYIAYEAAKLVKNEEVIRYTLHIMLGAQAEDYIFKPGESLRDLYAKPPLKEYADKYEYADHIVPRNEKDAPSLLKGMFTAVARFWRKLVNNIEDDAINRPYMAHFYDPTRAPYDRGLNVANGDIRFQSALDRLKDYWAYATNVYQLGKKPKAFVALGHMVHLISDMCVPAHVHNDIHGPTILLGKLDSLEQWAKRKDYPHLKRGKDRMNITIWDSGPLSPPLPDSSWTPENIDEKLTEFVDGIARKTQQFKSVDAPGTAPGQYATGKLTDDECYMQAETLIPQAILSSAQLIVNFLDYQRRLKERATAKVDL